MKGVSHVTKFERVARSYLDLCAGNRLWPLFSLNIFLVILEFVCFSRNLLCLSVNWSIFGTIDWYLQETSLSQQVSQMLIKAQCFWPKLLLSLFPAPWSFFGQLVLLFLLICLCLYQCAGEYVTFKEKHFSELLMCIISSILPWFISCGDKDVMALTATMLSLNMWIVFVLDWDWAESICFSARRIASISPW